MADEEADENLKHGTQIDPSTLNIQHSTFSNFF